MGRTIVRYSSGKKCGDTQETDDSNQAKPEMQLTPCTVSEVSAQQFFHSTLGESEHRAKSTTPLLTIETTREIRYIEW